LQLPEECKLSVEPKKPEGVLTASRENGASKAEETFQTTKLDELATEHIMRVLEQTKWRIEGPKGAALILGLHPSTVRSRILKLGIR
jgi:transcriptional regulator with GAF, ATPase, and Fis domain